MVCTHIVKETLLSQIELIYSHAFNMICFQYSFLIMPLNRSHENKCIDYHDVNEMSALF